MSHGLNVLSLGFFTSAMKCFPDKHWLHFDVSSQSIRGAL